MAVASLDVSVPRFVSFSFSLWCERWRRQYTTVDASSTPTMHRMETTVRTRYLVDSARLYLERIRLSWFPCRRSGRWGLEPCQTGPLMRALTETGPHLITILLIF